MSNFQLSVLCLIITLGIYSANKRLYRRFRKLPLMPLVLTPALLVLMLVFGHISWQNYIGESHWLLWLLGPATIAFAVPVYDNLAIIKRHWMSLTAGVVTATVVAVTSSVWLARLFTLSDEIQRSLAVRSVTTPFALAAAEPLGGQPDLVAAEPLGGQPDLVALFVVVTGVFGMAVGDALFLRLPIREGMAKGAGFGAASHGAGTARSYELGQQEGVVASLVMMLSGVVMVLAAPLVAMVMF
ncbi:TPA: LrgB family protein [Salmonella enterica]|nr:LrgB family protein [Salmonella enterica]